MLHGAIELGQDIIGGFAPDKRFEAWHCAWRNNPYWRLQIGDRGKDAAADEMPRHLGEEVLDALS